MGKSRTYSRLSFSALSFCALSEQWRSTSQHSCLRKAADRFGAAKDMTADQGMLRNSAAATAPFGFRHAPPE